MKKIRKITNNCYKEHSVCVYVTVSVYLCRNFYLINNKFGTQVGLVKIHVKLEDGLRGSHRDRDP